MTEHPAISWTEGNEPHTAQWRSESGLPPPKHVVVADDTMTANNAYRLACEGTALLWRGDFHNARQLLQAMARRTERNQGKPRNPDKQTAPVLALDAFNLHRQAQGHRARILGMVLLPFEADHTIPLRRAPNVQQACSEAYGPADAPYVASLRELQGLIGAHEWRKKGVEVPALDIPGARIYPHYGVFAPIRSEYVELVASAPLPASETPITAFDIGTGTGILAAVLAKRGIPKIIATELNQRALDCAKDNLARLGFAKQVDVVKADLFPPGRANLIVCNPPWVPARASSVLEQAVYDPDSQMLRGFLSGLAEHLQPGGEGWLILSDLAEHLGLRTRDELLAMFAAAGLDAINRLDVSPHHPRTADTSDPLHAARAKETTSLWRLTAR
jgi:methylase of polypeptide subunit release factors